MHSGLILVSVVYRSDSLLCFSLPSLFNPMLVVRICFLCHRIFLHLVGVYREQRRAWFRHGVLRSNALDRAGWVLVARSFDGGPCLLKAFFLR